MPNPTELLATSRLLVSGDALHPPCDAQRRRAVSTAYYALFHLVSRAGATIFMGVDGSGKPGYVLLYRGFSHGRMKSVCVALSLAVLPKPIQQQLGRTAISLDMADFSRAFIALQDARIRADYDPSAIFSLSDATDWVDAAEAAMSRFQSIPLAEKADILALMLASAR